ncbi:MAG: phosphodiester glycosidase family protein [Bacilli bacterium]|nr:phosphodiester glycosidase family protein [Bacilli bacterium]
MRYDEDLEIIDAFEDIEPISHIMNKPVTKKEDKKVEKISVKKENNKKEKNNNYNKKNKLLFNSIIFLPICSLIYLISLNSNILINNRISIFSLCLIILFLITLIVGIIKEIFIKRNIFIKLLKTTSAFLYISVFVGISILLYGNDSTVRDFIIDKAMSTTNHQYLATWLFDENTISTSLLQLKEATQIEINGSDKITFNEINYNQEIYTSIYEEQILNKENEDDLYKIIEIQGTTIGANYKYKGYLVAIYDPSKVKIGTSSGAGTHNGSYGEILSMISKKNNALVAMNAGGFYDPNWRSNGGIPHGAVIKDGKIQSEFRRGDVSGGLIGFNYNNELVLKRMTAEEAINSGIRDAVDWGPYLIVNGKNQYANVKKYSWATSRSAIGQRADGIVLMLVIDGGNQPGSYGASYADIAKIMENYGAVNAANLDGGTSTALVENNEYVNNPWNGHKRTIRRLPNAWIVVK